MIIQNLQTLEANPQYHGLTMRGMSEEEILELEALFNNGISFPIVLRELLFLAGNFCHVMGLVGEDTQAVHDEFTAILLSVDGVVIDRPHFYLDFSSIDSPLFVFLDEGDNPEIHQIQNKPTTENYSRSVGVHLKQSIEGRVKVIKKGGNPF